MPMVVYRRVPARPEFLTCETSSAAEGLSVSISSHNSQHPFYVVHQAQQTGTEIFLQALRRRVVTGNGEVESEIHAAYWGPDWDCHRSERRTPLAYNRAKAMCVYLSKSREEASLILFPFLRHTPLKLLQHQLTFRLREAVQDRAHPLIPAPPHRRP